MYPLLLLQQLMLSVIISVISSARRLSPESHLHSAGAFCPAAGCLQRVQQMPDCMSVVRPGTRLASVSHASTTAVLSSLRACCRQYTSVYERTEQAPLIRVISVSQFQLSQSHGHPPPVAPSLISVKIVWL